MTKSRMDSAMRARGLYFLKVLFNVTVRSVLTNTLPTSAAGTLRCGSDGQPKTMSTRAPASEPAVLQPWLVKASDARDRRALLVSRQRLFSNVSHAMLTMPSA
jgi:hypothetical protein